MEPMELIGFFIANAPNPSLKWESTTQADIGIDMAVFKGRLTVTADYYKKTTKDYLCHVLYLVTPVLQVSLTM